MKYKESILVFIFFFLSLSTNSQCLVSISDISTQIDLTPYSSVFEDSTSKLTFKEIQHKDFKPIEKKDILIPFSKRTFWFKVHLKNTSSQNAHWVIKWDNPLPESLDFYLPDSQGRYKVQKKGTLVSKPEFFYGSMSPHTSFNLTPQGQKIIFIRVQSQRSHYAQIELYTYSQYITTQGAELQGNGFLHGISLLRLFYVLLLVFFVVKDVTFRYYSYFLILRTFAFWGINSLLGVFFTQPGSTATIINFMSYHIMPIGYVWVVQSILPYPSKLRPVRLLLNIIIGITVILALCIIFNYQWYWLEISSYLSIFCWLVVVGLYMAAGIHSAKIDWSYSTPFLLGISSYILIQISLVTQIEIPWKYTFAYLMYIIEIFVFGLFLGKIIHNSQQAQSDTERELSYKQQQANYLKELDTLKTNFFTNISHEFRTPLTLIISPIQELKKKFPTLESLWLIERNAQRLLSLINQLLDVSKLEAKEMPVDLQAGNLAKFTQSLVPSFQSLAESRHIQFEIFQNQINANVYFDPDKFEKIIFNLLSNAFKFTPNGGSISLGVYYGEALDEVKIIVKDSGIGIPEQKLEKIFDRFFQVEGTNQPNYEGTGLGLTLVKELVNLLQGSIQVTSQQNLGTTFSVTLPLKPATHPTENLPLYFQKDEAIFSPSANDATTMPPLFPAPNTTEEVLLIVEDNEDLRTYIREIFENDYQIIEAVDGIDGLEKATNSIPDIIISDLIMPRINGFELCKYLKSSVKTSHIPIIILTGKVTLENKLQGLGLGADDYLIKPFNAAELKIRVQNLVSMRENLKQYYLQTATTTPSALEASLSLEEVFIQKIKIILDKNLSDSTFGVEQLAAAANLSASQLLRKLKALTNLTTVEFIRVYRLEKAAILLKQKNATVSEVAYQTGFENLSYFTKVFQERYHVLPSEY
ncbi:ATP-binding protein [Runella sp. MFBS21]|uniref:ATP-binding protein n=1 Tax=Runella sp. MFBS21 TaxID=3034018 RepID=UPI0023F65DC4|nr:ATP-binding protein [Runella sp. MFBS21]MDF7818751.1 ATP-binding protein [Runella sp. MFBS21]